ncbi:phosphomannomutase [Pseudoalteromonas sp. 3-MNA-CIBAN-0064]|uniref:phosphomannomutase n=1 Tax=unclassified Pseudoalteromonas TaxID=194690 RepID=UPI00331D1B8E|tara:strand:- start:957 stop:2378 length:1422 start_codon:yes stop_codon:yes gene_type:complete
MDSSIIIEQSGIEFGTSGARGLVTNFTNEVCFAFTLAFISTQTDVKRIAVAIDNRPSSRKIAQACISAADSLGISVDFYGVIPTPALALTAQKDSVPAIMVTGSHIPFDRNGLKFYTKIGEITKADEIKILKASEQIIPKTPLPLPEVNKSAFNAYLKRYSDVFPSNMLEGKRIGIYQHSSSGRDLYPELFLALGAEVICLGYSDEFVPIDTEAVADSDREQARRWTKKFSLDAIFSTDGDGDRPLLADEKGEYLTGDVLCMLAAKSLSINALAVPISCITSIERSAYFDEVVRTKIGSPYVIEALKNLIPRYDRIAGFEANGGFLLASNIRVGSKTITSLITRDALLPVLAVFKLVQGEVLSSLIKQLPSRFTYSDRIKNIEKIKSEVIIQLGINDPVNLQSILTLGDLILKSVNNIDGLRLIFTNNDIVHLRPSGNAPELRCYTESKSIYDAKTLSKKVLMSIEAFINKAK